MVRHKTLEAYFREEDLKIIERSIKEAEAKTSAELVPVLIKSSIPPIFYPLCAGQWGIILYFLVDVLRSFVGWELATLEFEQLMLFLGSFLVLPFFWSRGKGLFMLPSMFKNYFCEQRAELEFHRLKMWNTKGGTGVLLFISFQERHVSILADEKISRYLPNEVWERLLQKLLEKMKSKKITEGISESLLEMGELLKEKFPISSNDKNELRDELIIKE